MLLKTALQGFKKGYTPSIWCEFKIRRICEILDFEVFCILYFSGLFWEDITPEQKHHTPPQ